MRVTLAFDKFRGTFTAQDVCEIVAEGIRDRNPKIEVIQRPMADGGQGSAAILSSALGLEAMRVEVKDLNGKKIEAHIYWQNSRRLAVIESAEVLGDSRGLISKANIFNSNTIGLGQLLYRAFNLRPQEIWICIGGTVTTDLGWGIASIFGLNAYDEHGQALIPNVENMEKINSIDIIDQPDFIKKCKISVLCDVNSPARGPGFSLLSLLKQRNTQDNSLPKIERNVATFWAILKSKCQKILNLEDEYTGAGGGICIGLSAIFSNLNFELGAKKIAKANALLASLSQSDAVVCGEGCLDELTLFGKTVSIISQLIHNENTKLIGVFGKVREKAKENELKKKLGLTEIFKIMEDGEDSHITTTELRKLSKVKLYQIGQDIAENLKRK